MLKFIAFLLKKSINYQNSILKKIVDKNESGNIQKQRVIKWFEDNGEKTHRLNYNLNENSLVFDIGGYEGDWAAQIFCLYNCNIVIFEPYKDFHKNIEKKFLFNNKVRTHPFGLSKKDEISRLGIADNSSSLFITSDKSVEINLINAASYFKENNIEVIDLMKINIEGGEYDLLEHLIETDNIHKIVNLQIQFHDFVPNADQRMKQIQLNLGKTHKLTYQYEYVWENWQLKNNDHH